MKLHNTLTKKVENFTPLKPGQVAMYSCGPTVYDHAHIGNLIAFIMADSLRRTLTASGFTVIHVMNYTDVDDKTIKRSLERFHEFEAHVALRTLTDEYIEIFNVDMRRIGNDIEAVRFVRATDFIGPMQGLIKDLYAKKIAYIAEDGVYFSIEAYKELGRSYGQLTNVTVSSTSNARIRNDEYDKDAAHDFALWKTRKKGEPSWEFTLDGHDLTGRPGWHIECSVMSSEELGQPFDIHTGGVDLMFPHHENEIAQSTATTKNPLYASFFVHNEHLLVDGRKMSKSLGNFYTLENIINGGIDPLAFRLMVLQAHYRSQTNFTWENVEAAENRLQRWRDMAVLRWQTLKNSESAVEASAFADYRQRLLAAMQDDLDTPAALAVVDEAFGMVDAGVPAALQKSFEEFLQLIDSLLGMDLIKQADISPEEKTLLKERSEAKQNKDYNKADELRDQLLEAGIAIKDTPLSTLWSRTHKDE